MITNQQYSEALTIVEAYRKQEFEKALMIISEYQKDNSHLYSVSQTLKFKPWDDLQEGDFIECVSLHKLVTSLTIGKSYQVIELFKESFFIIDDNGKKRKYGFWNSMLRVLK